jgi:manganese efflux pump family protein
VLTRPPQAYRAIQRHEVLTAVPAATAGGVPPGASAGGGTGGSLLGRGSELAVQIAALIAWLITAASGGYVLVHWLRAGGRLRRRAATAVPPAVLLGHPALGLLGLVLWTVFVATGWVALAWVAAGVLAPVAGLGMAVLVIGLPSPRPAEGEAAVTRAEPAEVEPVPAGTAGTAVLVAPPAAPAPARSNGRAPVLAIALHGLFATTLLLLVITAAVGAG